MRRPTFVLLVVVGISVVLSEYGCSETLRQATTLADAQRIVAPIIAKRFPNAEESVVGNEFIVKANTMLYTLHREYRGGEISKSTYDEEGPGANGFLLRIEYRPRGYGGPLGTPQTMREAYWSTFTHNIKISNSTASLWIVFSYRGLSRTEFLPAILDALGKPPNRSEGETIRIIEFIEALQK
ncbi:hypothetical protein CA13_43120 [Planctomycetes bacterium CA13]|uniref:Uncharacterized protein n=1 Tax=Novipirellula herctigrandis TaxID=2527986 RepID=A0A5C5Z620_9BACT|nr:hypothetical protein CA13_43120 [Planctomycetes bacterium CA13]